MSSPASHSDQSAGPGPRVPSRSVRHSRLLWFLLPVIPLMFGFAFLNIPLFRDFCEHYGINPNPNNAAVAGVHSTRQLTMMFNGEVTTGLDIQFAPGHELQTVDVGKRAENFYTFYNPTDKTIRFRAIHALYPEQAAQTVAIMQCFCFTDQTLKPHQHRTLPVIYQVNPGLPRDIHTITWNYTLFPKKYIREKQAPWTSPKFTTQ